MTLARSQCAVIRCRLTSVALSQTSAVSRMHISNGPISIIACEDLNDRDVSAGNAREPMLNAPFVAIADVLTLQSHRSQRVDLGHPTRGLKRS